MAHHALRPVGSLLFSVNVGRSQDEHTVPEIIFMKEQLLFNSEFGNAVSRNGIGRRALGECTGSVHLPVNGSPSRNIDHPRNVLFYGQLEEFYEGQQVRFKIVIFVVMSGGGNRGVYGMDHRIYLPEKVPMF